MRVIRARNVHEALPEAIYQLERDHVVGESRNGPVWISPEPVSTVYEKPDERVLFWPERDANPFFHFFECLWMLAGRDDVAWLSQFNSNIASFSDDGIRFNGAYGDRWRSHFGFDQLALITDRLREDPTDRRQVLTMWDPRKDLANQDTKDLPCNDLIFFSRHRDGSLDMTVMCRSNDIIWGCYGANAVHFSFLQEYMAARIGCPLGRYTQMSNNWHGYTATLEPLLELRNCAREPQPNCDYYNPYYAEEIQSYPIMRTSYDTWDSDLQMFVDEGTAAIGFTDPFWRRVAMPLLNAWHTWKSCAAPEKYGDALAELEKCEADDWRLACEQWISRREKRWREKQESISSVQSDE